MWNNVRFISKRLLQCSKLEIESKRSTYVFRRIHEIEMNKVNEKFPRKNKISDCCYEVIENKDETEKPQLDLVLLKDIPGLGMIGETITTDYFTAYHELLLPKLAIYAELPEAKQVIRPKEEVQYSSKFSKIIGKYLSGLALPIYLSSETKWTLQPWHIKLALRNAGIMTQEECILLPEKEISGPDDTVENKDFVVKLIMNKADTFQIRCRIYHCTRELKSDSQNLDIVGLECNSLFPEDTEVVESLIKAQQEFKKTKLLAKKFQFVKK